MKQIPLLQGKALLIEIPEGAKMQGLQTTPPNAIVYADTHGHGVILDLPTGNWRIIGMLSEVREGQIVDIIDSVSVTCTDGTEYGGWRNYVCRDDFDKTILLNTALESLDSAILSAGWFFSNPYVSHPDTWDYLFEAMHKKEEDVQNWETAQSRVLDRSRCLLLGREI